MTLTVIGLILLILIAKEILVFNAEFLVLLTFVLFVGSLSIYLKASVQDGFKARANALQKEFYAQRDIRKNTYIAYLGHLNTQIEISGIFTKYLSFYKEVKKALVLLANRRLKKRLEVQVLEKLKSLARLEARTVIEMQAELIRSLPNKVRKDLSDPAVKEKVLVASIAALTSAKK